MAKEHHIRLGRFAAWMGCFIQVVLTWTPAMGLKFLLPESRKSYFIYFTRQLLSQVVQVYAASLVLAATLLPFVWFIGVKGTFWNSTTVLCPFCFSLHLIALVMAQVLPMSRLGRAVNYTFIVLSLLTIINVISGVRELNSYIARIHASCFTLVAVVVTIYVQQSSLLLVLTTLIYIGGSVPSFFVNSKKVQGEQHNGIREQVKQVCPCSQPEVLTDCCLY